MSLFSSSRTHYGIVDFLSYSAEDNSISWYKVTSNGQDSWVSKSWWRGKIKNEPRNQDLRIENEQTQE